MAKARSLDAVLASIRARRPRRDAVTADQMRRLAERGLHQAEAARRFRVPLSTFQRLARRLGVAFPAFDYRAHFERAQRTEAARARRHVFTPEDRQKSASVRRGSPGVLADPDEAVRVMRARALDAACRRAGVG
jgi:hypothetical protein